MNKAAESLPLVLCNSPPCTKRNLLCERDGASQNLATARREPQNHLPPVFATARASDQALLFETIDHTGDRRDFEAVESRKPGRRVGLAPSTIHQDRSLISGEAGGSQGLVMGTDESSHDMPQ